MRGGDSGTNSVSGAWRELSSSRAWGQAPEEGVLPGWLAGSLQAGWGWGPMQGEAGRVWFGAPVGAPWLWPSYRAIGSQEGSRLSDGENVLGLFWATGPQESTKPGVSVEPSYSLGAPACSCPCAPAQAGQGLTAAKLA